MRTHCNQPDHDVPQLICGYPIPCPFHTAIIDVEAGELRIPITAKSALRARDKLTEIGDLIADAFTERDKSERGEA